jgi:hypothetical protein
MLYDIPVISGFVEVLQFAETLAPFAEVTVLIMFFVSFFIFLRYGVAKAFAPSISIAFLTALFFFLEGLLPSFWVEATLALVGISVLLLYFNEG